MMDPAQAAGNLKIDYTLSFPQAQTHYVEVEMNISGITQPTIDLKLPVWTPGSYMVREYAKHLESFSAENAGKSLIFKKTDKSTWRVSLAGAKSLKVKYSLYCFEMSVRNNYVTSAQGFIVGASTFLYPAGAIANASTVHIKPYKGWDKVSTSLDKVGDDQFTVVAPNYDILYDSPIEVGNQDVFGFKSGNTEYEIAMCLGGNYDRERMKKDLKILVEKETAIFGENPNKRYVFLVHNYSKSGGGIEHLSSTVLQVVRNQYGSEGGYQRFLALAAHEHFHLWNVKRLRPIALGPFNYDVENYTTNLWIAEGFTAYYDNLVVHRMGLYSDDNYLKMITSDMNLIDNTPGSRVQPLAEASFDAWIKYYRPTENSVNAGISYYSKGSIVAMMFDLEIIKGSKGKYSLDDAMKHLYNEYYKVKKRGYTDAEFKAGVEKFAGTKVDDIYNKYITGLDAMDYNKYLAYAGLKAVDSLAETNVPTLGITMSPPGTKPMIATVLRGSAAWNDGLNVNDEITAVDGQPFTTLRAITTNRKVGDKVTLSVLRDGLPYSIPVTLLRNNQVRYDIVSVPNPTAEQVAVKTKWLKQ
ncbi:M61 family metallopeptidase [Mucilaginibacter myungsuensis]|uniref:M61 family metallopeptidase n=2 Tax=Mucilaginibacter myungsuensis TaxID=649104 RepID=A0A929KWK5_9SPHI|nr:M61 family metallopeptidase [Mucilaginibacter myungsuensis]